MLRDIGIDLGTANILVFLKDRGIILNEPSLVALDERTGEVIAVGERAYQMVGRTPKEINVHHPLKGGVIADIAVTEQLLEEFRSDADTLEMYGISETDCFLMLSLVG